jgi:hypothetical protein
MSEKKIPPNIDIKNSHIDINIDPHSGNEELIGSHLCSLIDEIYHSSSNEENAEKKNCDGDNKSEADDRKSTNLDSYLMKKKKTQIQNLYKLILKTQ